MLEDALAKLHGSSVRLVGELTEGFLDQIPAILDENLAGWNWLGNLHRIEKGAILLAVSGGGEAHRILTDSYWYPPPEKKAEARRYARTLERTLENTVQNEMREIRRTRPTRELAERLYISGGEAIRLSKTARKAAEDVVKRVDPDAARMLRELERFREFVHSNSVNSAERTANKLNTVEKAVNNASRSLEVGTMNTPAHSPVSEPPIPPPPRIPPPPNPLPPAPPKKLVRLPVDADSVAGVVAEAHELAPAAIEVVARGIADVSRDVPLSRSHVNALSREFKRAGEAARRIRELAKEIIGRPVRPIPRPIPIPRPPRVRRPPRIPRRVPRLRPRRIPILRFESEYGPVYISPITGAVFYSPEDYVEYHRAYFGGVWP